MSKSITITITITTVNIRILCWNSHGHSMYAGYSIQESIRGGLTEVDAQMNGLAQIRSSSVRPDDEGLGSLSDLVKHPFVIFLKTTSWYKMETGVT